MGRQRDRGRGRERAREAEKKKPLAIQPVNRTTSMKVMILVYFIEHEIKSIYVIFRT